MYTRLPPGFADTPAGEAAKDLIRKCVHCGFCLATCPTYQVLGDERDSPRGRIYLIKQMVEGGPASGATRLHLDRCLTCRACETTCPSGVEYGRLLDVGRELVEERIGRPPREQWVRSALAAMLSKRQVFSTMLGLGRIAAPVLPAKLRERIPAKRPGDWPAPRHARRMVVLEGCVQPALAPSINAAAARVLDRLGVSLVRSSGERCCGALSHHLARTGTALEQVRHNVQVLAAALDDGAEAIISTASGCGVMVKDYDHLLRDDAELAQAARRVAAATRDLCEVLEPTMLEAIADAPRRAGERVAWQSPCTLQHGQKLTGRVESLLASVGYELTPVSQAHLCCGSAGTYSILQPQLSQELRKRKLDTLLGGRPDLIATANIGCLEHLRAAAPVPVLHWIELIERRISEA